MGQKIDRSGLIGTAVGYLTVLQELNKYGRTYLKCQCECGVIIDVRTDSIKKQESCGCKKEWGTGEGVGGYVDGRKRERLNAIWHKIKERTSNQNCTQFSYYGGRGIKMCDEWKNDYLSFRGWALENGYNDTLTIDRYPNNDGDYEPSNCRWVTKKEQARNRRSNITIEYDGQKKCLSEWCEKLGLNYRNQKTLIKKRFRRTGKYELII